MPELMTVKRKGAALSLLIIMFGVMKSCPIPPPARMTVFPLPVGSQAIPTRGSKFFQWELMPELP
jgi:hypothetical protein